MAGRAEAAQRGQQQWQAGCGRDGRPQARKDRSNSLNMCLFQFHSGLGLTPDIRQCWAPTPTHTLQGVPKSNLTVRDTHFKLSASQIFTLSTTSNREVLCPTTHLARLGPDVIQAVKRDLGLVLINREHFAQFEKACGKKVVEVCSAAGTAGRHNRAAAAAAAGSSRHHNDSISDGFSQRLGAVCFSGAADSKLVAGCNTQQGPPSKP